jgi:hypothetical protein
MTSRLPFYFVDVFATRPLTGNPLSLVPDAGAGHNALGACLGLGERDLAPDEDARGGQAGSPWRFRGSAFASAAPAWSPRKGH